MTTAALEVEIINKVTNIGAFAEEKAAASSLFSGGVFGQGAGGGIFLGAPGSGAAVEAETKKATTAFKEYETQLKNAVIVSGEAGSITDGLARKMNALGQLGFTPMSLGLIAGVVGLGLMIETGKSLITNAEDQEVAMKSLTQAYATLGEKVPNKEIQDFITKNARSVGSMYDAEQGFASFARAGQDDAMQLRLMNDALDLAAAKGIALSQAVTILTSASTGMSRGLLELGVSQKDVNAALAKGSTEAEKYQALLALLEPRIKGARNNTSDLAQNSSKLNVEWQRISNENGPALEGMLANVVGGMADFLDMLRSSDWGGFSNVLVTIASGVRDVGNAIASTNAQFEAWLKSVGVSTSGGNPAGVSPHRSTQSAASPDLRQRGFTSNPTASRSGRSL